MCDVKLEESSFGCMKNGQLVKKYTLTNRNGFSFSVISYGAALQSINVKDKSSNLVNICLGFDNIKDYESELNPYFGSIVGRVSNRIANGEFTLNGQTFKLEKNNGNNCLHSGSTSLAKKNWVSSVVENDAAIKLTYVCADGEGGFPGELWIEVLYRISTEQNEIIIEYKAITDKPTPVSLTNHAYFNLAGENSQEKIYNQLFKINAAKYLDSNPSECTVTGKLNPVENTKYDFRGFVHLASRIRSEVGWPDEGFDNFFVLNEENVKDKKSDSKLIASVKNPENGVRLDVFSTENGVQFYTANFLDLTKPSTGQKYKIHEGFCLEAHNLPDSVNHSNFPSCILSPGDEEYYQKTSFVFSVEP